MKIRVAHILDGRHFGGAEQMVLRLAEGSKRVDVESKVYCLAEGRLTGFLRERGIEAQTFRAARRFDPRPLGSMGRAAARDGIQILQAHTSRTHLMARLLSRRLSIPNVTTIHSPIALDENVALGRHRIRAWVERLGRRWTDRICPVSRQETERLAREEKVPSQKLNWIPNGVEAAEIGGTGAPRLSLSPWLRKKSLPEDAFVVAMVAMFRPRKGAESLLKAFQALAHRRKEALLILIGGGEFAAAGYMDRLEALAAELGIGPNVLFTGFQDEPWAMAREADLIVLPSLFGEGLPLALIEAMNHARPIVASDIAGNRECIESGVNGWLYPPGDSERLAAILSEGASDRDRLASMGRRGREVFMERYELGRVLEQWRSLYEDLLGSG